jgi:alcohol dehydrogenase class IV
VEKLGIAARFVGIEAKSNQEAARKLIGKIRELAKEIGQPLNLKEAGVTEEQVGEKMDTLVLLASKDVSLLASPCECQEENLKQLFKDIWDGRS